MQQFPPTSSSASLLRRSLRRLKLTTFPEYIGMKFGVNTQRLTAMLEIVEAVSFVAVQILVSALLLSALFDLTIAQSSIIITAVFAIYTMMGGLWAVVWTDALQYVVLMVGIIIAVVLALNAVGGVDWAARKPAEASISVLPKWVSGRRWPGVPWRFIAMASTRPMSNARSLPRMRPPLVSRTSSRVATT